MKRKIQVIDADYVIEEGEVTVRCFGKSGEGENVVFHDSNFLPYLYALPAEESDVDKLDEKIREEEFEHEGEELPVRKIERKETVDGNEEIEVLKVFTSVPPKIPKLKDELWDMEEVKECREFDIPFYKRYLIDKDIRPGDWIEVEGEEFDSENFEVALKFEEIDTESEDKDLDWNSLAFDLEVYEDQVIMASFYGEDVEKVITTEEIDRDYVETVKTEKKLLERFMEFIEENDTDVLTGYNTDEFDFDVLRDRFQEHNLELSLGRNGERMKFKRRGRFSGARLKGRMHLDLYPFIAHVLSPGLESETLDLDSVAEEMLGENKDELSWEEMKQSWRKKEELEEFADYALKDSELAFKLSEEIVPQILELSRLTGLIPFDACRLTYGQLTENFLLREAHERGMIADNRPSRDKRQKRRRQGAYSGGFVYTPEPGIYDNIALFDFKSLPPDEEVYVKDPSEEFVKIEIGKLEDEVQEPSSWKVLSFNTETMKVEWRRLRKVVSHKNDFEYLHRFETETGKNITLTPNHSVYTLNEKGVPSVRDAGDLGEGDYLISAKELPLDEEGSIDLLELLKGSEVPTENIRLFLPRNIFPENERVNTWKSILNLLDSGRELRELRKEVDRHPEMVMRNIRKMSEKNLLSCRTGEVELKDKGRNYLELLDNMSYSGFENGYFFYCSIEDIKAGWLTDEMWEEGFLKLDNAYWNRRMPLEWSPDEEMCWSMGMFVAEGWADKNYARAHFSNTDEELLERLESAFKKFGPEKVEDDGDQEIRVGGGLFGRVLGLLFGRTSKEKKISEEVFLLQERQKKALLEGMIDGDGSVSEKSFKYTTCSRKLSTDLQNLLLNLGIHQTTLRKSREELYDLRVLSKPGEWEKYKGERQQHPLDLVPREYAEASINQGLKWGHRGPRIDRNKVFENIENKEPELAFFEGDAGLERIVEKKKIDSDEKLYDLSVDGNQNFFAGEMPVLVHNSLYPTVMVSHNISPDTLNLEDCDKRFQLEEFDYDFCQDHQGFFPELIESLVEDRSRIKQKMSELEEGDEEYSSLDNRQQAEKILANSVGPDTRLVLKDPDGDIHVLSVEEFYKLLGSKEKSLEESVYREVEGWKTLSVEGDKAVFKPVYAASKHNPDSAYRLKTNMGEVTVTADHSVIAMNGESSNRIRDSEFGALAEVRGSEISKEDFVAQVKDIDLGEGRKSILIPRLLENCEEDFWLYIPKSENLDKRDWYQNRVEIMEAVLSGMNSEEIQQHTGLGRRIIKKAREEGLIRKVAVTGSRGNAYECEVTQKGEDYLQFYESFQKVGKNSRHYTIPLEDIENLPPQEILENSSVANKSGRARNKIPAVIELDEELATLLGWFVAEGHVSKGEGESSYVEMAITSDNSGYRSEISGLLRKIFDYDASVHGNQVCCSTSTISRIFSELCGGRAEEKKVPTQIFNGGKSVRESFLKSYTKGDRDSDGRRLSTISRDLQAGLSLLLKEENCILHNGYDTETYRISRRDKTKGEKIVSGDLYGQRPIEIEKTERPEKVYDISVEDTEKFVTAEGLVLHNSFYGYLGYEGARWYSRECAEATTYLGREYIQDSIEAAEEMGFEVVYGDTDSVLLKKDNIRDEMSEFLEKVNSELPEFMELEFEGFFETGFFTSTDSGEGAKKKYALMDEDGKMKITGFEQVRRDWSPVAKEVQKQVLREVLEKDVEEAAELVKETVERLRERDVPVEKLRIYTKLTKKPEKYDSTAPHVEAAKKAMDRGKDISPGETVAYVITRGGGSISERAETVDYAEDYDSDYYIENQVVPATLRVLKVFDYTEGQLKGEGKQSGLDKFG